MPRMLMVVIGFPPLRQAQGRDYRKEPRFASGLQKKANCQLLIAYRKNQLPPHMPLLAQPVRFSDLFERKYLFNHRLDLAGLNQHTDFFQIAAARLHLRKQQPLAGHETLSKATTDPGQRRAKKFCFTGKLLRDRDCKSDEPSAELQDTKRCSPNPLANAIQ